MKTRKNNLESGFTLIEIIITLVVVAIVAAMMATYFGKSITQSSFPIQRLKAVADLNQVMGKITASYTYPHWSPTTTYAAGAIILPRTISVNRTGLLYTTTTGGTSGSEEPDWWTAITLGSTVTVADGSITWKTVWDSTHDSATTNGAVPALALINWTALTVYPINTVVYPSNGRQYLCVLAGTSGTTTPIWPTTSGSTVTELTGVKWQYIGYAPVLVLQTAIGTAGAMGTTATDVTKTFGGESLGYRVIQNSFIKFTSNTETNINNTTNDSDYGKYLKVTIGLRSNAANRTEETLTTIFGRR